MCHESRRRCGKEICHVDPLSGGAKIAHVVSKGTGAFAESFEPPGFIVVESDSESDQSQRFRAGADRQLAAAPPMWAISRRALDVQHCVCYGRLRPRKIREWIRFRLKLKDVHPDRFI